MEFYTQGHLFYLWFLLVLWLILRHYLAGLKLTVVLPQPLRVPLQVWATASGLGTSLFKSVSSLPKMIKFLNFLYNVGTCYIWGFLFHVYGSFPLYVYMCTTWVAGACGVQKSILDSPELNFQMIVSCHLSAVDPACVLWRVASALTTDLYLQPSILVLKGT